MKKRFFTGIGFLLIVFVFLSSCPARAETASPSDMAKAFAGAGVPLLRQPVEPRDFSLPLAADAEKTRSLGALRGKVVFLNFWATWCGPCRAEMPSMEALYRSYKDRGFEILAVNSGETEPDVLAFMERNSLSFPVVLDEGGKTSAAYGIRAIPTSFLLDREGKIILRAVGSLDWNAPQFRAALERLL